MKPNSLKNGRSNTAQKQSLCLTFAYDNTWRVLYISTHSSDHLHPFSGVRSSQSVFQDTPVYKCLFFQVLGGGEEGTRKKITNGFLTVKKDAVSNMFTQVNRRTSVSLFYKPFSKYILSLNIIFFWDDSGNQADSSAEGAYHRASHTRAAFQRGFAARHKRLPTRGGCWAGFQVRNKASSELTSSHKYLKLWSKGFVGHVRSHSCP